MSSERHIRLEMDGVIQLVFTLEAHDSYPMSYQTATRAVARE